MYKTSFFLLYSFLQSMAHAAETFDVYDVAKYRLCAKSEDVYREISQSMQQTADATCRTLTLSDTKATLILPIAVEINTKFRCSWATIGLPVTEVLRGSFRCGE